MSNREALAGVIQSVIDAACEKRPGGVPLIGVAGAQGCGKSFQCRAFAAAHPGVAHFSLDDVYKTRAQRESWAARVAQPPPMPEDLHRSIWPSLSIEEHRQLCAAAAPLFLTRGPPGTHDMGLANGLVARLQGPLPTDLPRFDKRTDDRAPEETWAHFQGPAETILIDGWCLGALPVEEAPPINDVEREDVLGQWRYHSWHALTHDYTPFFAAFDAFIYLRAPSFEIVRRWRGQQEEEMLGRAMTTAERDKLDRFIQFYERITRAMIDGHHRARWIVQLDEERNVVGIEER